MADIHAQHSRMFCQLLVSYSPAFRQLLIAYWSVGTLGPDCCAGACCSTSSTIDAGSLLYPARIARTTVVTKNPIARKVVARVIKFAVPRAVMKPPPLLLLPPIPRPPPSLRCSKMTATSATAIRIWMVKQAFPCGLISQNLSEASLIWGYCRFFNQNGDARC